MLHDLLEADLKLPPEYRDGLTNHLPMALHALASLGAPQARLAAFFDRYAARFEGRAAPPPAAPAADWQALRGADDAFAPLAAHFAAALSRDGVRAVLREALPALLPGVAAAAFHGVIRTAHAIESGHPGELAAALTYWAWRWQPLAPPPAGAPMAFDDWAAALVEQSRGWADGAPLISLRMAAATRSAPYRELAGRLAAGDDLLRRLTVFSARRYAETANFTVLHLVTGLRALRVVLPWAGDTVAFVPGLVHAVTAAYLAAKVRPGPPLPVPPALGWDEVTAAAVAHDDDHVIKLVHACRDHRAAWGDGPWLDAARRAVS